MAATIHLFGHAVDLKWVSLLTLALQNALLSILMHYSRISSSSKQYSASSAVLMNELLKGSVSILVAIRRVDAEMTADEAHARSPTRVTNKVERFSSVDLPKQHLASPSTPVSHSLAPYLKPNRWRRLGHEIFSPDCWKLSIPAILYVVQNNLQYVAASNLDVATFQVTYQMKILTTAFFSVLLLGKRLSSVKWLSLLLLAVGVGIVQIQSTQTATSVTPSHDYASHAEHKALRSDIPTIAPHDPAAHHEMNPFKGFMAVTAACLTSGLAGVYFEMVLKGTKADLWTRNIQLSFFSLIPALVPVLFTSTASHGLLGALVEPFANFSVWAWATVFTQVFGGLVTAIVIKYSDNILKGFATSLSIILSFLASVMLFAYPITPAFLVGSIVVLSATWMYNQPEPRKAAAAGAAHQSRMDVAVRPGSPIRPDAPIIGETPRPSRTPSVASLIGLANSITRSSTPTTAHGDHLQPSSMAYAGNSGYFTPSNMSPFPSSQALTPAATPPNLSPSTSHGFTPRHHHHGSTTPTGTTFRPPIHINTSNTTASSSAPGAALQGLHIHLPDTVEENTIPSSPFTASTSFSSGPSRNSPVRERKGSLAARTRPVVDASSFDKMR
ncbi:hypothetical protein NCC49_001814 [Naganishia albida]|nr:hypothetical protein NCC49_001814 [Naganishia albida]